MTDSANKPSLMTWLAPTACLVLLLGVKAEWAYLHSPDADSEVYHRKVRKVAAGLPDHVGNWQGHETEVPEAAVQMLKPNVLISRMWRNRETGQHVSMLIVQCKDARHLLGHYPPVCYAGQGWSLVSQERKTWNVAGFRIRGTEYFFGRTVLEGPSRLVIQNFMVLPSGQFAPNMDAVDDVASDRTLKFLGAAQVQLIYDERVTSEQREDMLEEMVEAHAPLLKSVLFGVE